MNLKPLYDCVLVSAFGRSELLALELAQRGFRVAILDLTQTFRDKGVELRDVEGPFPMVTPTPSFPSHLDWMVAHSSGELVRGFSVWLKSGPIEMRGPLSSFYSDKEISVGFLKDYLAKKMQAQSSRSLFKKNYAALPFEDSWLIHLSHALSYYEMRMHRQNAYYGEPFPLNQSSQLLQFTEDSLNDLKASAIHAGVDFIENRQVTDIVTEGKEVRFLQLEGNQQLRSLFFSWALSQEETYAISPDVFRRLFQTTEPVLSDWKWQRISLETDQEHFQAMPESFLMIENPEWFWSGENFVLFKKVSESTWDLWLRVPRQHPEKDLVLKKIREYLTERLGTFDGRLDWITSSKDLVFFPIFERGERKKIKAPNFKNVVYEGIDQFDRLDLSYRFQIQVESLARFEVMKQKHERQNQKKGGSVDHQVHAP